MTVRTDGWEPGEYDLEFAARCQDDKGNLLSARANRFFFELREPTSDVEVELLRREAVQLYLQQRHNEAEAVLTRLDGVYPTSFVSRALRGHMAVARREPNRAQNEFDAAIALIERNEDVLFTRFSDPPERDLALKGLRSRSRRAR